MQVDFRLRLGESPPAAVEPLRVRQRANVQPVKAKARRYSPEQRAFLDKYIAQLIRMGFCEENATADWQEAPLLVPKRASRAKFRLAIDLRPVNSATIKEAWPMPHLDSEVNDFRGSCCFSTLDFVSGYWQLPVHPDSYHACGIVTPRGVVVSKRVLPGLANATSYFQSTVEPLFRGLRENMKAWLDDFHLHAQSEMELLGLLETFFSICQDRRLFLSARKCTFFAKELRWCGRLITPTGYEIDPGRIEALRGMKEPETASELSQFVHCVQWMRISIPNFAQRISSLASVLEKAYKSVGRRTTRAIKNITLQKLSWGDAEREAFVSLQNSLCNAVRLSYQDPDWVTCLFTDASDKYWSAIITPTSRADSTKPLELQQHRPLAFLGSAFRGAQLQWSTFEKEGFSIFSAFEKCDYLMMGENPVRVFMDHRNLRFVFAPTVLEPALGRHIVSKVQRWALFLSRFSYEIDHVQGNRNVFADILTRWAQGNRRTERAARSPQTTVASVCVQEDGRYSQLIPSASEIEWPDMEEFRKAQRSCAHPGLPERQLDRSDGLWKTRIRALHISLRVKSADLPELV